jgi:serine/threonine protein kinase
MNSTGQVKLCDFGVSVKWQKGHSKRNSFAGSPYWMSPEIIRQSGYDYKADIWSLGITIFELLTGKPPLFELKPEQALVAISRSKPARLQEDKFSIELRDFMTMCLNESASQVRFLILF